MTSQGLELDHVYFNFEQMIKITNRRVTMTKLKTKHKNKAFPLNIACTNQNYVAVLFFTI